MHPEFEAVIGLEVHCQLATDSKIFCRCRARLRDEQSVSDVDVNTNTCPVCAGHPGTLPTLNRKVVEYAVKVGLATNCSIRNTSVFSRKNYFYPDLPKGYQITQYDKPICENGFLEIETQAGSRRIHIQRIHIEEDAGKNVHAAGFSLVNLNRAGVPLVEIVSGPDMKTAEEAGAYLRGLHAVVTYLGISDGNMQEGNFRCDANVSVMPKGSKQFGTRAEIKNVNSFRFVEKAIEFEIARQTELILSGGKVKQETRGYDSTKNITTSMRSKEEAQDYRYFPEPDLIPLKVSNEWIEEVRSGLPELPAQKKNRYVQDLGLSAYDAGVLTGSQALAQFFEDVLALLTSKGIDARTVAKSASNWMTGEVARLLNEEAIELHQSQLTPTHIADLVALVHQKTISNTAGKQVVATAWKSGESIASIVDREGLKQVSDSGAIESAIDKVIGANAGQVADYRSGKDKLFGFFVGQVMKEMAGKANPAMIQDLLKAKLKG